MKKGLMATYTKTALVATTDKKAILKNVPPSISPQPTLQGEWKGGQGKYILTFPENLLASSFDDLEGYVSLFLKKARRRAGVAERKKSFMVNGRTFEARARPTC